MLTGMPGVEPTVQIVLPHAGVVYHITASGKRLSSQQGAALASLRFVPIHRR
jgi:hypothetical protein